MTRRQNKKFNRRQQRRRFSRRRRTSRAVLPPAKSIMGHIWRSVIQAAWDIAQGALSLGALKITSAKSNPVAVAYDCDDGWLLADYWRNRVKGLFREMKVHRITAHYVPYESITAPGEYIFTLCDYGENITPSSMAEAIGSPASVVRKNGMPAKLVWYPTEPDDRNWHIIGDEHKYCTFSLRQMESTYNVDTLDNKNTAQTVGVQGKVVIECEASFRGKPSSPTYNVAYDAPRDSPEQQEYLESIKCLCQKCLRPLLKRMLIPSGSGSSSPFSLASELGNVSLNVSDK